MTERRTQVCLVLLALSVFAVYAFRLEHTPPHLHRDEMMFALQAQSIAATGHDLEGRLFPLYFEMRLIGERVWFQPILVYVTALFLKVLPLSEQTVRIPSTVIGVIDVLLMYFIARRLFESRSKAFGAAALLAITPAHVIHSRLAMDFIYPVPFVMAWLLCLLIYLERRQLAMLGLATALLGVGFFSYIASMITMPLLVVVTLLALWSTSTRKAPPYAVAVAGFLCPLLVMAPWLLVPLVVRHRHAGPLSNRRRRRSRHRRGRARIARRDRARDARRPATVDADRAAVALLAILRSVVSLRERRVHAADQHDAPRGPFSVGLSRARAAWPDPDGDRPANADQLGGIPGIRPRAGRGMPHRSRAIRQRSRARAAAVRRADRRLWGGASTRRPHAVAACRRGRPARAAAAPLPVL